MSDQDFIDLRGLPALTDSEKLGHINKRQGKPITSSRLKAEDAENPDDRPEAFAADGKQHNAYLVEQDGLPTNHPDKDLSRIKVCKKFETITMTDQQKEIFLSYLTVGMGLNDASIQVGISRWVLRNTMQNDDVFRDKVKQVDGSLTDQCLAIVFEHAMNFRDPKTASMFIGLKSKIKMDQETVSIARRKLKSQEKLINQSIAETPANLNFSTLTSDEFDRYTYLYSLLSSGSGLTTDEKIAYADLSAKIHSSTEPMKSINVSANVDKILSSWDED